MISTLKNLWHHNLARIGFLLLFVGLFINFVTSLVVDDDIGFFSENTVFTTMSTLLLCVGVISNLTKNFDFFCFMAILAIANILFSIQPIKMWTDEGNLCSSLSSAEQKTGRECFLAASGAVDGSSFSNLISLVTTCYSNNNILTGSSGVCYNIRWGQSTGDTIRAFMFISWFCQFFGTLVAFSCAVKEVLNQGEKERNKERLQTRINKVTYCLLEEKLKTEDVQNTLNALKKLMEETNTSYFESAAN